MLELKNYMEDVVFQVLDRQLKEHPYICDCDKCRLDMAAVALNELPPRYIVTERGMVFAKVSQLHCQSGTDVLLAILKAMDLVGKNPRH